MKELRAEINRVERELRAEVGRVEVALRAEVRGVFRSSVGLYGFLVSFLGYRDVLSEEDVRFAKEELSRIPSLEDGGPLPGDVAGRVKALLDKDFGEWRLEDAEWLYDVARRWVDEEAQEELPWRFYFFASMARAVLKYRRPGGGVKGMNARPPHNSLGQNHNPSKPLWTSFL